jgi:phosphate transport system substrate-binding protein
MKFSSYFFPIALLIASHLVSGCGRPADSAEREQQVSIDGGAVGFSLLTRVGFLQEAKL